MIKRNEKELTARYIGKHAIQMIYKGKRLIWQLVSSCFGAGFWQDTYPWKNADGWKNNVK